MGATPRWRVQLRQEHSVRAQYSVIRCELRVYVDEVRIALIEDSRLSWDEGDFDYEFQIEDAKCKLIVGYKRAELWVAGVLQPQLL